MNESLIVFVFQFGIYLEIELDFVICMLIIIGIDFKLVKLYLIGQGIGNFWFIIQ